MDEWVQGLAPRKVEEATMVVLRTRMVKVVKDMQKLRVTRMVHVTVRSMLPRSPAGLNMRQPRLPNAYTNAKKLQRALSKSVPPWRQKTRLRSGNDGLGANSAWLSSNQHC